MNPSIRRMHTKREIAEKFPLGADPRTCAEGISDEELEGMLDAISDSIPFRKDSQNQSLELFLYAGCTRFNRWFSPSPYVVPPEFRSRFRKFVDALKRVELGNPTNCSAFEIHAIKDELFHRFEGQPVKALDPGLLNQLERRLTAVRAPLNEAKLTEFLVQKKELKTIFQGMRDGSLRTELKFEVPYILHRRTLTLTFLWKNISIRMEIAPVFRQSGETFVNVEGAAISVGASRWQSGTSKIKMSLFALIDGSAYTERLQAIEGHQFPVEGWPRSFNLAFEVFYQVAWQLRVTHGGEPDWVPAPRDLSHLEFCISTATGGTFGQVIKGSPASLIELFCPLEELLEIDIGELKPLKWSVECRSRAKMYLELGDTNEALFWLNVGVEALIADRFVEIEASTGIVGLAGELGSPKAFWAEAEETLSKQFPELADKVKWPTADVHVSIFGKLKALYKKVHMLTLVDDLIKRYRAISSKRNDLFHGRLSARVSIETITAAFNAFDWMDSNMWPSGHEAKVKP